MYYFKPAAHSVSCLSTHFFNSFKFQLTSLVDTPQVLLQRGHAGHGGQFTSKPFWRLKLSEFWIFVDSIACDYSGTSPVWSPRLRQLQVTSSLLGTLLTFLRTFGSRLAHVWLILLRAHTHHRAGGGCRGSAVGVDGRNATGGIRSRWAVGGAVCETGRLPCRSTAAEAR